MLAELIFDIFKTGFEDNIERMELARARERGRIGVYEGVIGDITAAGVLRTEKDVAEVRRVLNHGADQGYKELGRIGDRLDTLREKRQSRIDLANQVWLVSVGTGALIGVGRALGWF